MNIKNIAAVALMATCCLSATKAQENENLAHSEAAQAQESAATEQTYILDKSNTQMNNALSKRQQSLMAIASFEAKGDSESLKTAINEALDGTLTVNEVKETLSHLYAYTGFPRSLNALGTLQTVLQERRDKGLATAEGRDASPLPHGYDALKQGTEVQRRLVGGRPYTYSFAPATDFYLKAHLFGDIFARDVLSHTDRELVTVSALASMDGVWSRS